MDRDHELDLDQREQLLDLLSLSLAPVNRMLVWLLDGHPLDDDAFEECAEVFAAWAVPAALLARDPRLDGDSAALAGLRRELPRLQEQMTEVLLGSISGRPADASALAVSWMATRELCEQLLDDLLD